MTATPTCSIEHVPHLARHVERRQKCPEHPKHKRPPARTPTPCRMENLVLAPKPGEKHRHSGQRHHANRIRRKGRGHPTPQSAHSSNVLLMVASMNDRARSKEQERFEKRVSDQMKIRGDGRSEAYGQKHISKLRYGRIGENFFDIVLKHANSSSKQGCCSTNDGYRFTGHFTN